jgi:hypothetical protein
MTQRCLPVLAVLPILLLPLVPSVRAAGSVINPHIKPGRCESCHAKVPTKEDEAAGNLNLLKDTIDDTCHMCHPKVCCDLNALHTFNHPSGFDHWDKTRFRSPKTLPLQNGFITCNTCHFHSIPDGPSYKMVRIVHRDGEKIEWSPLCRDCHEDK